MFTSAERSFSEMLQFPYQDEPLTGPPPPSLSTNAMVRWRPLVPVAIVGPTGKRRFFLRALLDPGADDTVFPVAVAADINAALRSPSGHGIRWRGQAFPMRFADVTLELADGSSAYCWPAIVAFSQAPIKYP